MTTSDDGTAAGTDGDDGCGSLSVTIDADFDRGRLPFSTGFALLTQCGEGDLAATWDFGDGYGSVDVAPEHRWLSSGTHTVTVTVTDDAGSPESATVDVTVLPAGCPRAEDPVQVGILGHAELDEASGVGVSGQTPGVLWSHNDSGDQGRFFAMSTDGSDRGTWNLLDAPDGDWEDMAMGLDPSTGDPLLYLGDIGDNQLMRETLAVYVVPEPAVPDAGSPDIGATDVTDWWSFELAFADGVSRNGDAMMLDPVTGDLHLVVTNPDGTAGVYRAPGPYVADTVVELLSVGTLDLQAADPAGTGVALGADFSPLGDRVLVRTAEGAWVILRDQSVSLDEAWASGLCPVVLGDEVRGEGIAFTADGGGYVTVSEELHQPIWSVAFEPEEPPCAGLTARILTSTDPVEVGRTAMLSVDPLCVPAGLASASWDLDDGMEPTTDLAPEAVWLASGTVQVQVEITDLDGQIATGSATIDVAPASCPVPGDHDTWGAVESGEINEASGLGHSALNPGVLWTHNDSGDGPRLFAMGEDGALLGTFTVDTLARDWEDLAMGWDATFGADALYVGDVGDNGESRSEITVLVVPEPMVDAAATDAVSDTLTVFSTLTLTYPDGPHNCETVMVDPVTGDLLLVTKDYGGDTAIFRKAAPHIDDTDTQLELVAELQFGSAPLSGSAATTAGAFSPLGDRIAIRTYSDAWMWRRDQAEDLTATFDGIACDIEAPSERQGEALTFSADGSGYIVVSEGGGQPIIYTPLD